MLPCFVFVNQKLYPSDEAGVPVSDLAVLRGYGVFDFFRLMNGVAPFFDAHWERLEQSAAIMHLQMPFDAQTASGMMQALHARMPYPEAGVRITITGGSSPNGFLPGEIPNSLVTLQSLSPLPAVLATGDFGLMTYPYQRSIANAKTIDYSMGIWLLPQVVQKGFQEVLYVNSGRVTECPRSNVFIITENGVLITPDTGILYGITRMRILQLARKMMPVEERDILQEELLSASEVFITSTTKGIQPVSRIDDHLIPKGGNPLAALLYQLLLQTR